MANSDEASAILERAIAPSARWTRAPPASVAPRPAASARPPETRPASNSDSNSNSNSNSSIQQCPSQPETDLLHRNHPNSCPQTMPLTDNHDDPLAVDCSPPSTGPSDAPASSLSPAMADKRAHLDHDRPATTNDRHAACCRSPDRDDFADRDDALRPAGDSPNGAHTPTPSVSTVSTGLEMQSSCVGAPAHTDKRGSLASRGLKERQTGAGRRARQVIRKFQKLDASELSSTPTPDVKIGQRIAYREYYGNEFGTIRWLGRVPQISPDWTVGIEFDNAIGEGDGSLNGRRYFIAKDCFAKFLPLSAVALVDQHIGRPEPGTMISVMSAAVRPGQMISIQRVSTVHVQHCFLNAPHRKPGADILAVNTRLHCQCPNCGPCAHVIKPPRTQRLTNSTKNATHMCQFSTYTCCGMQSQEEALCTYEGNRIVSLPPPPLLSSRANLPPVGNSWIEGSGYLSQLQAQQSAHMPEEYRLGAAPEDIGVARPRHRHHHHRSSHHQHHQSQNQNQNQSQNEPGDSATSRRGSGKQPPCEARAGEPAGALDAPACHANDPSMALRPPSPIGQPPDYRSAVAETETETEMQLQLQQLHQRLQKGRPLEPAAAESPHKLLPPAPAEAATLDHHHHRHQYQPSPQQQLSSKPDGAWPFEGRAGSPPNEGPPARESPLAYEGGARPRSPKFHRSSIENRYLYPTDDSHLDSSLEADLEDLSQARYGLLGAPGSRQAAGQQPSLGRASRSLFKSLRSLISCLGPRPVDEERGEPAAATLDRYSDTLGGQTIGGGFSQAHHLRVSNKSMPALAGAPPHHEHVDRGRSSSRSSSRSPDAERYVNTAALLGRSPELHRGHRLQCARHAPFGAPLAQTGGRALSSSTATRQVSNASDLGFSSASQNSINCQSAANVCFCGAPLDAAANGLASDEQRRMFQLYKRILARLADSKTVTCEDRARLRRLLGELASRDEPKDTLATTAAGDFSSTAADWPKLANQPDGVGDANHCACHSATEADQMIAEIIERAAMEPLVQELEALSTKSGARHEQLLRALSSSSSSCCHNNTTAANHNGNSNSNFCNHLYSQTLASEGELPRASPRSDRENCFSLVGQDEDRSARKEPSTRHASVEGAGSVTSGSVTLSSYADSLPGDANQQSAGAAASTASLGRHDNHSESSGYSDDRRCVARPPRPPRPRDSKQLASAELDRGLAAPAIGSTAAAEVSSAEGARLPKAFELKLTLSINSDKPTTIQAVSEPPSQEIL